MICVTRDAGATQVDGRAGQQRGIGLEIGLPDDHGDRLQQEAHADGRDQRRQPRAVAQRAVGHLLDAVVQGRCQRAGDDQGDDQHQPGRQQGLQDADDRPAHERAHHEHLAMREVDQADDAVDHGVAQGDQGVHAAQDQAVDDLLKEDVHR
jgi:hypothetical protein